MIILVDCAIVQYVQCSGMSVGLHWFSLYSPSTKCGGHFTVSIIVQRTDTSF
jgi:hypothetical protein